MTMIGIIFFYWLSKMSSFPLFSLSLLSVLFISLHYFPTEVLSQHPEDKCTACPHSSPYYHHCCGWKSDKYYNCTRVCDPLPCGVVHCGYWNTICHCGFRNAHCAGSPKKCDLSVVGCPDYNPFPG